MLFAYPGIYEPSGLFSIDHLKLIIITIVGIIIALNKTINKSKDEIKQIIKKCTIIVWFLEAIIITFKLITGGIRNINNYVPLYYCSLLLYAGGFASFAKGKIKRAGEVFLATGGIAGGILFIIFPSTSLTTYPMFHIVSLHSYLFHGIMVYLGILINATKYITLKALDIKYYASLVGCVCILAYIINLIFGSNLMFISGKLPVAPVEFLYDITGPFYTIVACIGQMTLPFFTTYGIIKFCNKKLEKKVYV